MLDYGYIFGTILFTVYGQFALKMRIGQFGPLPTNLMEKIIFLVKLIFDPVIFSGFFAGFLASLSWMAAMTKFELSHAYPFMSLNFVIVLLLSGLILSEPLTVAKIIGTALIVCGTIVVARG
ncbi:EamA family transporter [Achromobacter aloeverae]